jgi:hypothetical protein
MTIGVLMLGRSRLEDERQRTATALKANDEVKAQLKGTIDALDSAKANCSAADATTGELQKQILTLELTNRRQQEELTRLKKNKR